MHFVLYTLTKKQNSWLVLDWKPFTASRNILQYYNNNNTIYYLPCFHVSDHSWGARVINSARTDDNSSHNQYNKGHLGNTEHLSVICAHMFDHFNNGWV